MESTKRVRFAVDEFDDDDSGVNEGVDATPLHDVVLARSMTFSSSSSSSSSSVTELARESSAAKKKRKKTEQKRKNKSNALDEPSELLRHVHAVCGTLQSAHVLQERLFAMGFNRKLPLLCYQLENVERILRDREGPTGRPIGGILCEAPGTGKTICIISATALCRNQIQFGALPGNAVMPVGPDRKVLSLQEYALRACHNGSLFVPRPQIGLELDTVRVQLGGRRSNIYFDLILSLNVSLYILPSNLVAQFSSEVLKFSADPDNPLIRVLHCESPAGLTLEQVANVDLILVATEALSRFDQMPPLMTKFCSNKNPQLAVNVSGDIPLLFRIRYQRLFVDEGFFLGSTDSKKKLIIERIAAVTKYVISGTPFRSRNYLLQLEEFLKVVGGDAECVKKFRQGKANLTLQQLGERLSWNFLYHQDDVIREQRPLPPLVDNVCILKPTFYEALRFNELVGNALSNMIISRRTGENYLLNDPLAAMSTVQNFRHYMAENAGLGMDMRFLNISTVLAELRFQHDALFKLPELEEFGLADRGALFEEDVEQLRVIGRVLNCDIVPTKPVFAKVEKAVQWITEECTADESAKVLVYAFQAPTFTRLKMALSAAGFPFRFRFAEKNNALDREQVSKFINEPDSRVLLANDRLSHGLNLTVATHVLFVDVPDNQVVAFQALHRAYRLGQTRSVKVLNLALEGCVLDTLPFASHQQVLSELKMLPMDVLDALDDASYVDPWAVNDVGSNPVILEAREVLLDLLAKSLPFLENPDYMEEQEESGNGRKRGRGWMKTGAKSYSLPSVSIENALLREFLLCNYLLEKCSIPHRFVLSELGVVVSMKQFLEKRRNHNASF